MASLTVRQLDDKLKKLLRLRAARHGRSMEDEVRVILREAAEQTATTSARCRAAIAAGAAEGARDGSERQPRPAHHRRRHRRL